MAVIVTGASSFIGIKLVRDLMEHGMDIVAVNRPDSTNSTIFAKLFADSNCMILNMDMSQYCKLDEVVKRECPGTIIDGVVAMSWNGTRGKTRDDAILQESNYRYCMDLMKAAVRMGSSWLMTAGSQAEYGRYSGTIDEAHQCRPNTEYGRWKLRFFEDATSEAPNGFRVIEPRFFSIYGPDDEPQTLIIDTVSKMLRNEKCEFTPATQVWNYLYIDDLIKALRLMILGNVPAGAYNLGSDDTRQLKEFIEEIYRITGSSSELVFGARPYTSAGVVNVDPSIDKIKKATSWKPHTSFEEGIKKIISKLNKSL